MAVYFVQCGATGLVKIGHTTGDVRRRVTMLQTGAPGGLTLLGALPGGAEIEAHFHQHFADLRRRGEWFECAGGLAALVATLAPPAPAPRKNDTREYWNGMTRTEVERATGISGPMLSRIRKGDRVPSPDFAIRIQRACGVSAIKLVFGDLAAEAR